MTNVNVVIAIPNKSVSSMVDEIEGGQVASFVDAAQTSVVAQLDTDGNVPVVEYSGDLDDALAELVSKHNEAGATVFVVATDYVSDDHAKAIEVTRKNPNTFFLLTEVSNQPVDGAFRDELDADEAGDNNVDTITVGDLSNASVALKELTPHLKRVGANV